MNITSMRLAAVAIALCVTAPSAFAEDAKPQELTPAQKKQVQAFAAEFKRAKDPARLQLIRIAGEGGPAAVEPLMEIIGKELSQDLTAYRQQYMKAAGAAAAGKLSPENIAEITDLRAKMKDLSSQEELTKEMIAEIGDPALARLKELILIGREAVVKRDPKLDQRRETLAALGKQWEAAAKVMKAIGPPTADGKVTFPSFDEYLAK